jgi:hypothetical protein
MNHASLEVRVDGFGRVKGERKPAKHTVVAAKTAITLKDSG